MSDVIKRYIRKNWKDHLVEYPDRKYLQPAEGQPDGVVDLIKAEGDIYQQGDAISAGALNNMEEGIENNNRGLIRVADTAKATQLKLMILEAAVLGGAVGGLLMEDFEDITDVTINRGIYDTQEKSIYCYDSTGNKIELIGLGAAIA